MLDMFKELIMLIFEKAWMFLSVILFKIATNIQWLIDFSKHFMIEVIWVESWREMFSLLGKFALIALMGLMTFVRQCDCGKYDKKADINHHRGGIHRADRIRHLGPHRAHERRHDLGDPERLGMDDLDRPLCDGHAGWTLAFELGQPYSEMAVQSCHLSGRRGDRLVY